MGTWATLHAPSGRQDQLQTAATLSRECLESMESALSVFRPESDIARINISTSGAPVLVAPQTAAIIQNTLEFSEQSGGAFDPTVGPLLHAWGFRSKNAQPTIPDPDHLAQVRKAVGYRLVLVASNTVTLTVPGVQLDLGGIAKGMAVDQCFTAITNAGILDVMVNLGGNIRCAGHPSAGRSWQIGVRHPFQTEEILGTLALPPGMATATSGNYERFVTINGKRYGHIMDPRTGHPCTGIAGVTIIAGTATETDALSTALFVMGPEKGVSLLAKYPSAEAMFIPDQQPVVILMTPGFAKAFTPDPAYKKSVKILPVPAQKPL